MYTIQIYTNSKICQVSIYCQ